MPVPTAMARYEKSMSDMHRAAERGDWRSAIEHARSVPVNWNSFDQLPQYNIPPHAIEDVVRNVPPPNRGNFLFELSNNMHPGYSHDQLKKLWALSNDYVIEKAILNHPNWNPSDQERSDMAASEFWHNYETKVKPSHFAAIKSLHSGKQEEIKSHRDETGSSSDWDHVIPHLNSHAKKVQDAIMKDSGIEKKYFNGKPYIRLYRGVAGNYGKKITEAAGMKHDLHSVEDRTLSLPVANMASWTLSKDSAQQFALTRGDIPGQEKGHGVVMSAWHPVESVLHSGFHQVHPGQRHAHPSEEEIVVAHPTGKVKAKTKHMMFQRSIGGSPGDETFSHTDSVEKPDEVRPKPFRKSDIFNFMQAHTMLFKSIKDLDFEDLILFEKDGLIKAMLPPKNPGETHPFDPNQVARQHPYSKKLSWHTAPRAARATDEEIGARTPQFLSKLGSLHRQILTRAINDVSTSPTRHFRIGWDKDPKKQVLRARHIKALLSGQESAKIDLSDPNKVVLVMDRHRGIPGEATSWTLTPEGGYNEGGPQNELLRRNEDGIYDRSAGHFDDLYDWERSVGDVPAGIYPFDPELQLGRYYQDPGRIFSPAEPSRDYHFLRKSPVDTDPSSVRDIEQMGSYSFDPKHDRHVKTNALKGGLYHHVFQDKKNPSIFTHVISQSQHHDHPTLATVEGETEPESGQDHLNVSRSYVQKEHAGHGYGKIAYAAALMHHGEIRSDSQTSKRANMAWGHMKEKVPGINVRLGSDHYDSRHSATVRGDGSKLREYLGVLKKTEQGPVRLIHYSHLPNLTRLDPSFYGTGHRGAEHRRAPGPRTFYYFEGTEPESVVTQRAPYKYTTELPEGHKIYDVGQDPHGVISRAKDAARTRPVNPGILTPEEKEEAVQSAGYQGMYDSTHPNIPNAVVYFHPLDVRREK